MSKRVLIGQALIFILVLPIVFIALWGEVGFKQACKDLI